MVDDVFVINVNGADDVELGKYEVTVYYEDINRDNLTNVKLEDQDITLSY